MTDARPTFRCLPDLVRSHAALRPDGEAIVFGSRRIPWRALAEDSARIAAHLVVSGVGKGSRVSTGISDPCEFVTALLGTLDVGAIFVPLPTWMNEASLAAVVDACHADYVLVDGADGARTTSVSSRIIDTSKAPGASGSFSRPFIQPDDAATILFSSGTTNIPKGALHTHGARFSSQMRFIERFSLSPKTVTLIATPLYTSLTWASLLPTLAAGGKLAFLATYDADEFTRLAVSENATLTMMVPTQYEMLVSSLSFTEKSLRSFEVLIAAGARSRDEVRIQLMETTAGRYVELLGSTETDALTCLPAGSPRSRWGSVGTPLSDAIQIKIVDANFLDLPRGTTGRVLAHTPSLMVHYDGMAGATESVIWTDASGKRFYVTGDLGSLDDDGYLWLVGRERELIISAGFKIHPSDLEAVLLEDEAVAEAAVVGLPNEALGEVPLAFVVLRQGFESRRSSLLREANARLSDNQRMIDIRFLDALPRNSAGKVMKHLLLASDATA